MHLYIRISAKQNVKRDEVDKRRARILLIIPTEESILFKEEFEPQAKD
jgi:hypothetical protein